MANETTRPLKVFLCHASGDKPAVRDLYKRLIAEGVDAWLDQEKLLPGQNWRVEIPRAVREADVVVICLSNKSITKEGYIQKEIKFALDSADEKPEGTIFLIPARLEKCAVPEQLGHWQWVDLFEENGFVRLLRSLKLRADRVGATIEPSGFESEDKETERRLDQLYTEGLAAFYTEDWDRAYQRFQSILRERPNHKNAAEKLAQAERQRNFVQLYTEATEAYQSENWQAAIKALEVLLETSADYKDAAHLLKDAKKQKQLGELYAEAKRLHTGQKWQAVIRVFDQIAGIDSAYPDPDGLLLSAQREAAELKRLADLNDLYSQAVHKMDAGDWYEARSLLEQIHKAQTGFLDTERLLRKVENEILKIEEGRKRTAQVQMLYEQARKMTRAGQWGKALAQMEEIQKLDNQFVDSDGILEKTKAELEREEQDAQRRRELTALYAEAVSLLEAKKYQEALEKWNEIQAIDPKYKDTSRVKATAKRKLDELSRPEMVGRPWSKIISDWTSIEANISADREILTEKLLLLGFAASVILFVLWTNVGDWLKVSESAVTLNFIHRCLEGGLYGAVVAFALNKIINSWQPKHSLNLVIGWALGFGVSLTPVLSWTLPPFGDSLFWYIALFTVVATKWAQPATKTISLIAIFLIWILAWKAGSILGVHLGSMFNPTYTWAFADAFSILLGLLFTFGMQVERSWEVLRTALFGALGFAVGNYIADIVVALLPPTEILALVGYALWGLIGGAILEAPSRNIRRIAISATVCGAGLLIASFVTNSVLPNFQFANIAYQGRNNIIWQIIWGAGIGLALGALIQRPSAIGVMVILGAGMFMVTHAMNAGMPDFSDIWKNILRGALIGLVLGYGYGYIRNAKLPESKLYSAKTRLVLLGLFSLLVITGWLFSLRPQTNKIRIRILTSSDWTVVKLLNGGQLEDVKILSSSSQVTNASFDGEIFGLNQLLEQAGSNIVSMTVEAILANTEPGVPLVFEVNRGGIGKTTIELSNVVVQPVIIQTLVWDGCCDPQQFEVPVELFMRSPYRWDFDNGTQGWGEFHDLGTPETKNGYITFISTGLDPSFESLEPLAISAFGAPVITVRMRNEYGQGTHGQIFFKTDQDPNWDETKSVVFTIVPDGTFQTYNILMSENPAWQGVVTGIRFDPVGDPTNSDIQIALDYISTHTIK